ncbi:unnamed protein product [Penicillium camemberti]|uniref:Str. FM013 n=1 Tax=Penicillium camemberti (strain FM 013) TaxID=1429867 RepID=A0A0G4PQK1_PENC3|nr:unnamed protein product [Penicillium camemberti]
MSRGQNSCDEHDNPGNHVKIMRTSLKGIVTQLSPVSDDAVCNSHDAFGGFYWPVMLRHIY